MRRAVAILMLLLVSGSATGVFAAASEGEAGCEEDCGDGGQDCCPLVCPRCVCAAQGVTLDLPGMIALPVAEGARVAVSCDGVAAPEAAEPQEILHIPIPPA